MNAPQLVGHTSDGTAVWHTGTASPSDTPKGLYTLTARDALYRGIKAEQLTQAITFGIDVPPGEPFFASQLPDKPWEYAASDGAPAVLLVLDRAVAERSFFLPDEDGAAAIAPDKSVYPYEYTDADGSVVHTRFNREALRGATSADAESYYGYWISPQYLPEALLAVVIGGPRDQVSTVLDSIAR
ncbi:hypothetical protein AXK56_16695 [Tsukamurella pulmonis]|uniref:Uncharacterized protein n=1 Tax=Tsukamurella pulmonis TaxID=47312 RepID=A0A1H1ABR0_9ACTN|nr:hypothetical protein [Tsukamurella pulmonis]KXO95848.1 hypothetical protein AXK56_16695 [Tsukamurella pulmonis]SDQ37123.1 hypothetical protein SAMN04489765_0149 [Tsukamurella pulmonis]SUQ39388.1 Uncharacterised protein [Tsukamurella pulmonis]